jgi:hypothetical protein
VKTTVELPDELLRAAKRVAIDRGTTLRELVEAGLRRELEERERPGEPWKVMVWHGSSDGTISDEEIDAEIRRAREGRSFPEFGQPVE